MSNSIVMPIPSAQVDAQGTPRFQIPVAGDHPQRATIEALEADGGVQAETRVFLDAQLETGDALLDLDPGIGVVALSAATAPNGSPAVFVAGLDLDTVQLLQDAAADAGGWVEDIDVQDPAELCASIDARLESDGRVFVHSSAAQVIWCTTGLRPLIDAGRVVAICVSDAAADSVWAETAALLAACGFVPHALAEQDGEVVLLPVTGQPMSTVIAVAMASDATATATAAAPAANAAVGVIASATAWNAVRDGFSFIAPHSRTGYGVAASHLLRALQQRQIPVTFFPLGPVDATLLDNPRLREALVRQEAYRPDVPSVRLSQQFDLALHVGRGPQVGFTIFELDTFTPRERHHLEQQDAIITCSQWGREVIRANGISVPVHVVPLGVDRAIFHEGVAPAARSQDTVFLQVGKLEPRKGQLELLRAFEAAFTPQDAVRLVLVCGNPFVSKADLDVMLMPFRRSPMASRITLITQELPTQREVATQMAAADCGVFAVRAEGWNLEALELLSMGKQVIATNYSAHTEFLTAANARLIDVDGLEPAHQGRVMGQWAAWGARQHEQLVQHLRDVHTARQVGTLVRNEAGIATAMQFSWEHAADALLTALSAIA
ncbi:MAG: glycosyltransferase family 4 protein [Gemmatimonadaceae bacterium]|nr:glycosyltransferase family 4 protein [Gemmatimonadaceae bacterium]